MSVLREELAVPHSVAKEWWTCRLANARGAFGLLQYIAEMADSNPADPLHKGGRLRPFPLIAATFFMVSGGPYGIEDTLGGAGYLGALLILAIVPFVWSLPTTLIIGVLASAMGDDMDGDSSFQMQGTS
jgi:hypothetical protein